MRYFTWELELVSYILLMVVAVCFLFSCPKTSFSFQQKQFNGNYSHTRVLCLLFICTSDYQETKSNMCNQIEVLLQRDFRLKVLTE